MIQLSIIVCTYNPRSDYFTRVLNALRQQTLPYDAWELLVVDNNSDVSVAEQCDLSWHPYGRHINEKLQGLTPARIKGIKEAKGELLIFVDDDNVLDDTYLLRSIKLISQYSFLGVIGGQLVGEYEIKPNNNVSQWVSALAIRSVARIIWSNEYKTANLPVGAGMVVKREVALAYAERIAKNEGRQVLDRKGDTLWSSGDVDLVYTAVDLGYGYGLFPELLLTHLIPKERLTEAYILKLRKYQRVSTMMLNYHRFGAMPPKHSKLKVAIIKLLSFRKNGFSRKLQWANLGAIQIFNRLLSK